MSRKTLLVGLCMLVALLPASALAQTAYYTRIEGTVYLKEADGTEKPVSDALVEIYALDIFKQQWKMKTSKRGFYTQNGVLEFGTYLVVVSGPGLEPSWINNVRPRENNTINVRTRRGDGARLSMDEVQVLIAQRNGAGWTGMTPDVLAISEVAGARMDAAKKEYEASGDAAGLDAIARASGFYNKGIEMMRAGDFRTALSLFDQAPATSASNSPALAEMLSKVAANSAESHYQIGVNSFNLGKRDEAKASFERSVAASRNAIRIASGGQNSSAAKDLPAYHYTLARSCMLLIEFFGAVEYTDETFKIIERAARLEPGNNRWKLLRGDLSLKAGRVDEAAAAYMGVLTGDPRNLDALYGLGLSLVESSEKERQLEAEKSLSSFLLQAPVTDRRVTTAKVMIQAIRGRAH